MERVNSYNPGARTGHLGKITPTYLTAGRIVTWIVDAISAAKPPVNGASWAINSRPVLATDCNRNGQTMPSDCGQTLSSFMGKACYRLALRPPVGPMRIPVLTLRLLEPPGVFLANFKSVLQWSCLGSLETKECFAAKHRLLSFYNISPDICCKLPTDDTPTFMTGTVSTLHRCTEHHLFRSTVSGCITHYILCRP